MKLDMRLWYLPGLLIAATVLASCGGGSGGSAPAPAPPPPPPILAACTVQVVADTTVEAGKTGAAAITGCNNAVTDVSWTQVSGPALTFLAARSSTLAFEAGAPGVANLRAELRFSDGSASTVNAAITIAPAPAASFITLRADHAVPPGADTSLRAWPTLAGGDTLGSIAWTQVAGPVVAMNTDDKRLLMFRAPQVAADTVLRFRATMTTASGRLDHDEAMVVVEPQGTPPQGALFERTARVHPYRAGAVYAGALAGCVYQLSVYYQDAVRSSLCTAGALPLLQTEAGPAAIPSVAQIMGRVLVSHDFLGANFEQFLLTQDPHGDFRRLLAGATAIVIGSHVRPSFYMGATGAIYLDAAYVWLTPAQRDVVSEVPDYRLAYDDELNYSVFGREVKDNAYARRSFPVAERLSRDPGDLVYVLGKLLYHELAHAADFFPPSERNLDPARSIWLNAAGRIGARSLPSDALAQQYPLTSVQMKGLGQVLFLGARASDAQKAYSAADVGGFFASDRATDDYAYSIFGTDSSREDLAMLFEEFMMGHRHGVQSDIAFTNLYAPGMTNEQVIVAWGARGRIAAPAIKPRIKLVLERVAPWIAPAAVDALPPQILLKPGVSWEANLVQGAGSATQQVRRQDRARTPSPAEDLKQGRDYR